jgi:hypothetical protein
MLCCFTSYVPPDPSKNRSAFLFRVKQSTSLWFYCLTLKKKSLISFETSVNIYSKTHRKTSEDLSRQLWLVYYKITVVAWDCLSLIKGWEETIMWHTQTPNRTLHILGSSKPYTAGPSTGHKSESILVISKPYKLFTYLVSNAAISPEIM